MKTATLVKKHSFRKVVEPKNPRTSDGSAVLAFKYQPY